MAPLVKKRRFKQEDIPMYQTNINDLPIEILTEIFRIWAEKRGTSKLFVLSRVCRKWKQTVMNPILWTTIDCRRLSIKLLMWLCRKNLLSNLTNVNLSCVCDKLTNEEVEFLSSNCPKLQSLEVSNMEKNITPILEPFVRKCCLLQHLTLSNVRHIGSRLKPILESISNLSYLNISDNFIVNIGATLKTIALLCPNLTELYLKNMGGVSLVFPVSAFMESCINLSVISLECFDLNTSKCANTGFPKLHMLLCPTSTGYHVTDKKLMDFLICSPKLKTLDIRGSQVSAITLFNLDILNLESLSIARSHAVNCSSLPKALLKWRHSLKHLDISRLMTPAIEHAILEFITAGEEPVLEKLDISSSTVSLELVLQIVSKCPKLKYLNLESCRELPRGKKRIYYSAIEVHTMFKEFSKDTFEEMSETPKEELDTSEEEMDSSEDEMDSSDEEFDISGEELDTSEEEKINSDVEFDVSNMIESSYNLRKKV